MLPSAQVSLDTRRSLSPNRGGGCKHGLYRKCRAPTVCVARRYRTCVSPLTITLPTLPVPRRRTLPGKNASAFSLLLRPHRAHATVYHAASAASRSTVRLGRWRVDAREVAPRNSTSPEWRAECCAFSGVRVAILNVAPMRYSKVRIVSTEARGSQQEHGSHWTRLWN